MLLLSLFIVTFLSTTNAGQYHLIDTSRCNTTVGCFPPDKPIFTWLLHNKTHMTVEVQGPGDGTGWIAIGFSNYAHKGQDYIIECSKLGNGNLSMKYSWNNDGPANLRIEGEQEIEKSHFSDVSFKVEDKYVYCKGLARVDGWSQSILVLNITNGTEYYFKYAFGTTFSTGLVPHAPTDTLASWKKIDFWSKTGDFSARGPASDTALRLKQAHAILMVLAWICFIPTALLFARFLKGSWPDNKPMGMAMWFHVHRTANLLGLVLMVASFICIMCAMKWKWMGPGSGSKYWYQIHSMLGLVSLILAWLQPFISLLRCGPTHTYRWLFNWVHRFIGVSAYILATATLGVAAFDMQSPSGVWSRTIQMYPGWKLVLVLLPIALVTACFLIIPIVDFLSAKAPQGKADEADGVDRKKTSRGQTLKEYIVFGVIAILIVDAIVISGLIFDKLRPLG